MYSIGPLPLTDIFRISKILNVSNHQKVFSAKKAENQKVILAEKSFLAENQMSFLPKALLTKLRKFGVFYSKFDCKHKDWEIFPIFL